VFDLPRSGIFPSSSIVGCGFTQSPVPTKKSTPSGGSETVEFSYTLATFLNHRDTSPTGSMATETGDELRFHVSHELDWGFDIAYVLISCGIHFYLTSRTHATA